MKKPKVTIDPRLVLTFVDTWNEMGDSRVQVETINSGWCYQMAIVFQKVYGGRLVTPGYSHGWVRINGLDYDSDNLHGSDELRGWTITEIKATNRKNFSSIWSKRGYSGRVRMDIINETVKRFKALIASEVA